MFCVHGATWQNGFYAKCIALLKYSINNKKTYRLSRACIANFYKNPVSIDPDERWTIWIFVWLDAINRLSVAYCGTL